MRVSTDLSNLRRLRHPISNLYGDPDAGSYLTSMLLTFDIRSTGVVVHWTGMQGYQLDA